MHGNIAVISDRYMWTDGETRTVLCLMKKRITVLDSPSCALAACLPVLFLPLQPLHGIAICFCFFANFQKVHFTLR